MPLKPNYLAIVLVCGGVLTAFVLGARRHRYGSNFTHLHSTRYYLCKGGERSRRWYEETGKWPTNLLQMPGYRDMGDPNAVEVDGWGHPFEYESYDPAKGYGIVRSLGRDGKPGGTGYDKDLEFRFNEKTTGEEVPAKEPSWL